MHISFITIYNAKMDESIRFWTEVMGFHVVRDFAGRPGMRIVFVEDGPCQVELISGASAEGRAPGDLSIGFRVPDLMATAALLAAKGVTIKSGPMTMPSGTKLMTALDPNGVELGFVEE